MKRGAQLSATFLALLLLSACSAPKEAEAPTNTASAESDEAIKQEAKSIEAAANEAAALVEAEANAEIKAMGPDAGSDETKGDDQN
jgi:uncharacterized lipoprotein YajG